MTADQRVEAACLPPVPEDAADAVRRFTQAVLRGDEEHRAWLAEAAEAFIAGRLMPEPRGLGKTNAALTRRVRELEVEVERLARERDELKRSLERAEYLLSDLEEWEERTHREATVERLTRERDEARRDAECMRGNADDNYAKLQAAEARLARAREVLEWTKDKWDKDWKELVAVYDELKARAEAAEKERDEALERASDARDLFERAFQALTEAKAKIAEQDDLLDAAEARLARAREALQLPLIFFSGGPMTTNQRDSWLAITGHHEITSKVMCDAIRRALADSEPAGRAAVEESGGERE